MNYLIIFNHPFKGSYCNALLDAVQEGLKTAQHSMDLIHLDNEQFNPVMTAEDLKSFRDKKPSDRQVIAYQQRLEKAEQEHNIQAALNRMSPEHRAVLILKDMEGQKYEVIAEILQVPIGTIRSRLHRARIELREILQRSE